MSYRTLFIRQTDERTDICIYWAPVGAKKCEKLKHILLFYHFTLEIINSGVFLPITKTPNYSTTVPNSVNYTQGFMCIKHKAFLPCKQHPRGHQDLRKRGMLGRELL